MKQNDFPDNWDEERVQSLIAHYKQQTEDEAVAEDEAAFADNLSTSDGKGENEHLKFS